MKLRTYALILVVLLLVVFAFGVFILDDGRPPVKPKFREGQTVEMRFGTDQGLVMDVDKRGGVHVYKVKFYYKNGTDKIKTYREYELVPKRRN